MLCLSVNYVHMRSYEVVLVLLSAIYMYRLVEPTAPDSANWTNQIRSAKIAHKHDPKVRALLAIEMIHMLKC